MILGGADPAGEIPAKGRTERAARSPACSCRAGETSAAPAVNLGDARRGRAGITATRPSGPRSAIKHSHVRNLTCQRCRLRSTSGEGVLNASVTQDGGCNKSDGEWRHFTLNGDGLGALCGWAPPGWRRPTLPRPPALRGDRRRCTVSQAVSRACLDPRYEPGSIAGLLWLLSTLRTRDGACNCTGSLGLVWAFSPPPVHSWSRLTRVRDGMTPPAHEIGP